MEAVYALTKVAECLYRNSHGTYFALVKVNGKQIKRSLKTDDAALARRRLNELRLKAQRLTGTDRKLIFDGLAQRWLAMKKPDLKPASHKRLDGIIRAIKPFFGGLPVRSIGHSEVERWKIARSAVIGPRSFNYERDVVRQIFEYARLDLRILLENPAETVKRRKEEKRQAVIPSKEQFKVLLSALRAEPRAKEAGDFIEFLGYSGLRLGEAIAVRWEDVNFDLGTLAVTGGEAGTKNHEGRTIPMFPPLRRLLEDLSAKRDGEGRVFGLDSAKKSLETACRKNGLPHFGHHAMRHFFCSNAIEAGCDFKVIAEWLGHKDGGVLVARTYGHLRNEHSAAMAKRITFDAQSVNDEPKNVVNIALQ